MQAIAALTDTDSKYLGAPSMAYEIGRFTVTRDGALEYDELDLPEGIDQLLQDLERSGIEPVKSGEETKGEPAAEADGDSLSVAMPRDYFSEDGLSNLQKLVESKETLLKKAVGTDELPIEVSDERVSFPWFHATDPDSVKAYTHLVEKISSMAVTQKRVTAKEKEVDNEKYTFRCFLLRLGFIGAEYKTDRKILLANLTGSSAFKSGVKGGAEQ